MAMREDLNRFNASAQALGEAAAKGDLVTMRAMLAADPGLAGHSRPFSDACKNGQPEAVLELIGAGVDVNTTAGAGPIGSPKPLLWVCRPTKFTRGHRRVLAILLDHGADPNGNPAFMTPLQWAALWGCRDGVALLVERGAHIGFFEAVGMGDVDRVRSLLALEPSLATAVRTDCVWTEDEHATALHVAAASKLGNDDPAVAAGLAEITRELIARGAPVDGPVVAGRQIAGPLGTAARCGNVAVLRLLLEHGATVGPTIASALAGNSAEILAILGAYPFDPELPGDAKLGNRLLHELIRFGRLQNARWLIEHGAGVNVPDNRGWTPLHYAASRGVAPELVGLLLARGADAEAVDQAGLTPLAIARREGHAKLIAQLESVGQPG